MTAARCLLAAALILPAAPRVLARTRPPADARPAAFHRSEAFVEFRRSGHEVVEERSFDADADGLPDAIVVERSVSGLGMSVFRNQGQGRFSLLGRSKPSPASSLHRWEQLQIGGRAAFLLDVCEDNPDEAVHWLHLFLIEPGGVETVFSSRYWEIHSESDAGRDPIRLVDLGGIAGGLQIGPGGERWPRIHLREDPKRLELLDARKRKLWILIGIRERLYEASEGRYALTSDRYLDFLERLVPAAAEASSAQQGCGAELAVDGDLDSAWVEGVPGAGFLESLTVRFARPVSVRVIRLVPGCADSAESWKRANRIERFSISLGSGSPIKVRRGGKLDRRVLAVGDFGLPGRTHGQQMLIFLKRAVSTRQASLVIEEVEQGEAGGERSCVAEWSLHRAHVDQLEARGKR
ncbi:MAG: hypothetical protein JXR96_05275 [Deltaproteobacteria bacterium]|nr:hypothetical protein [Deltaproteobacteria bacterium]